ncbi:hypothetical protein AB0F71_18515 [Kitasatospora sp. NPDC028055]|uniref:hypothetical protein n=1 Tax=Kitasatospora sp. NPDC028055 TaxID=3155653 RepID=UPI00340BEF4F
MAATTAVGTAFCLLRLLSIRNEFAGTADRAAQDQMTYRGFLAEQLTAECDDRARRSERRSMGQTADRTLRLHVNEASSPRPRSDWDRQAVALREAPQLASRVPP